MATLKVLRYAHCAIKKFEFNKQESVLRMKPKQITKHYRVFIRNTSVPAAE